MDWRQKTKFLSVFLFVLAVTCCVARGVAWADVWNNAIDFYNKYGDSVVFRPTSDTDGDIYFGSRGNVASTNVKYRVLGWKVSIRDSRGGVLQTLYFKKGGTWLRCTDTRRKSGYIYDIYRMSLSSLKSRLDAKAREALENGSCELFLDACMTVTVDGTPMGEMTDSGPSSGRVYTTCSGIVGAQNWSSAAKKALPGFFGKEITGLFHEIRVVGGEGIRFVSGGGNYCYGTWITVRAEVESGYVFDRWVGLHSSRLTEYGFYVTASGRMKALVVGGDGDDPEPSGETGDDFKPVKPVPIPSKVRKFPAVNLRFISGKYFEDENGAQISEWEGGLRDDCRWALDENLRHQLRGALN